MTLSLMIYCGMLWLNFLIPKLVNMKIQFSSFRFYYVGLKNVSIIKQAGAELCQAQPELATR